MDKSEKVCRKCMLYKTEWLRSRGIVLDATWRWQLCRCGGEHEIV